MKIRCFFTLLSLISIINVKSQDDAVLLRINGEPIYKSEFEYLYNKNNNNAQYTITDIEKYLDLFVNYKLKVTEARNLGLDTTAQYKKEIAGYREDLAKPYLIDQSIQDDLLLEAYERLKTNVEVSHILLMVDKDASAEKEYEVLNKIRLIKDRAFKGEDFNTLAYKFSEDPSAKENKGYLGFISGFTTLFPFEDGAYNTSIDGVSEPVRTEYGYHIIKVHSKRNDPGENRVAHILKLIPANSSKEKEAAAKKQIDDIYQKVMNGEDFGKLAVEFSEDNFSSNKNGELPWFGSGRMVKEFEDNTFRLENPGDISVPFRTPYGWHIVKLIERRGVAPIEKMKNDILRRFIRDERGDMPRDFVVERLKDEYSFEISNYAIDYLKKLSKEISPSDTAFYNNLLNTEIDFFAFDNNFITLSDFGNYLKEHPVRGFASFNYPSTKVNEFISNSLISYENKNLESKYPDFRNLYNEYKDGILLFEISNSTVWEKAGIDDKGLNDFFKKNKKSYSWSPGRYKGLVVQCKDEETQKLAKKIIKKAPSDSVIYYLKKELNSDSQIRIKAEKGIFQVGENKVLDCKEFKVNKEYKDDEFPVTYLKGKILKKGPESYNDVRGFVTSDYQNYLEQEWVEKLKKKYNVEIDKDVLKTVKPISR